MPNPLIGLDVDGVVADLAQQLLHQVFLRTGKTFQVNQIQSFDLRQTLGDCWNVGQDLLSEPGFALSLPPYPHALEGVERLRKVGRVVFVTTPFLLNPTWASDRTRWLEQHTGAKPRDIVHLEDKTLFAGRILIEDSPAQLEGWVATHRPAIRVIRPWNQNAPGTPAKTWDEIVQLTEQLLVQSDRTDSQPS